VAILPIGGTILAVAYVESMISSSGIGKLPYYFPGLGILAACALVYLLGLITTTFFGRLIWNQIDGLMHRLPALGRMYGTLKQILGYGEGKDAIFHSVVMVPSIGVTGEEMGLITNACTSDAGVEQLIVFVPGAPTPTTGRLIVVDRDKIRPVAISVHDALKALVSVGKVDLDLKSQGNNPT
ncbi:MAG: DUF502 domain-containing protein, partial [Pirellulaceae bacterium]|nr:DUF502 domain-containing protein [Pirellulaceae bacterium]